MIYGVLTFLFFWLVLGFWPTIVLLLGIGVAAIVGGIAMGFAA